MTKMPHFIHVNYIPGAWNVQFNYPDSIKDAEERITYKQQIATALQVRYNTLRNMDTERLAESPTVRSLLYDAAFFFQDYLDAESDVDVTWDDQVALLLNVLRYVLGGHDDIGAVSNWERFKELQNNAKED